MQQPANETGSSTVGLFCTFVEPPCNSCTVPTRLSTAGTSATVYLPLARLFTSWPDQLASGLLKTKKTGRHEPLAPKIAAAVWAGRI